MTRTPVLQAEEGVRCMVLIWDDRTSVKVPGLAGAVGGMLSTHDEETLIYFQNTGALNPQYPPLLYKGPRPHLRAHTAAPSPPQ